VVIVKKEHRPLVWLVINLALLGGSMFMKWFMLVIFDPPPLPFSGWDFIFWKLFSAMEELRNNNFQWFWFLALLEGMGGIFVIGYSIFIIIKIARRKVFVGSRTRSIVLVVIAMVFLLNNLGFGSYLGYWFFMAGVFSSAVLEWQYSRVPVDLLTGKRTRRR
jgi:hypothetical protein